MAWLKSVKSPTIDTEKKSTVISTSGGMVTRPRAEYQVQWDTRRIIEEALERVTWVYRCVDAISSNAAKVPMVIRRGNSWDGELIDSEEELLYILNSKSNVGESSYVFKYRLSAQLLLSEKGVFIEVVRDKGGNVSSLQILPSDFVTPIPDPKKFVSGYDFKMDVYAEGGVKRIEQHLKPEQVIWIRKPHPFDPYKAMTALPSSGIAIETDWNAKLYNRNFLLNDGRPGGLVVIKGDATEEDKEELRARFRGGPYTAGRISVITSAQGADFVDTAVTPRDAQHIETRGLTQAEILMAFGVPKSVLADASARTFDNAELERLIFWQETMLPHMELIMRSLDVLLEENDLYIGLDLEKVDVLQRMDLKRKEYALREFDGGAITVDEYREETGRQVLADERGKVLFRANTRIPYATIDGSEIPEMPMIITTEPQVSQPNEGRPADTTVTEQPENDPAQREDDRTAPLPNSTNK